MSNRDGHVHGEIPVFFHVRAFRLLTSFPYISAKEFLARPVLACSVSSPAADLKKHLCESVGAIETGDVGCGWLRR